jgi:hypothetical protein
MSLHSCVLEQSSCRSRTKLMEIEPSTTRPGATGDVPTYVPRIAALLIEISTYFLNKFLKVFKYIF